MVRISVFWAKRSSQRVGMLTVSAGRLSPRLFSVPSGASAAPLPAPKESVGHSVSLSIGQRVYVPSWVPPV